MDVIQQAAVLEFLKLRIEALEKSNDKLEHDNIELKNANKLAHERIKELKEVFRATHKSKYELIEELEEEKTRVKELEEEKQQLFVNLSQARTRVRELEKQVQSMLFNGEDASCLPTPNKKS